MDWQTKEYIDEQFDEVSEKLDLIMEKLEVDLDNEKDISEDIIEDKEFTDEDEDN